MKTNHIYQGDCLEVMQGFPDNCIDSIVTDPPYGWSFMGKQWDYDIPAVEVWQEALRVLKPGGHALIACGTRTQHRMAVNIEDAGFEIRDLIMWHYGSGFPKSYNIGKNLNKYLKTGNASWNGTGDSSNGALGYAKLQYKQGYRPNDYSNKHQSKSEITEELAKKHEGWGTALKPATEIFTLARKPLGEKTIAENVLKWGTGGINIDGCRIGHNEPVKKTKRDNKMWLGLMNNTDNMASANPQGRWPANVTHDGSKEVRDCFPETKPSKAIKGGANRKSYQQNEVINPGGWKEVKRIRKDEGYSDNGGSAAKFFYTAKASRRERSKANDHPTVKPIKLMKYLVKLITPSKGICLDLYAGSGSTVFACIEEGFNFVAIEIDPKYIEIANQRINNAQLSLF